MSSHCQVSFLSIFLLVILSKFILFANAGPIPEEWKDRNNHLMRTPTDFLLDLMTMQDTYSASDFDAIIKALFHAHKILSSSRLWSGGHYLSHFIGVGSCALKAKLPAKYVVVALMHSLYLYTWPDDAKNSRLNECKRRNFFKNVFGVEQEALLYRWLVSFGNGPWHTCPTPWVDMHKEGLFDEVDRYLLQVALCDEADECVGGDIWLGHNWKRRSSQFESQTLKLAELENSHIIRKYLDLGFRAVHAVFPAEGVPKLPKDVTTDEHQLFWNTSYLPEYNYDSGDHVLIKQVQNILQHTRKNKDILGSPQPLTSEVTSRAIESVRMSCDAYATHETINLTAFAESWRTTAQLTYSTCNKRKQLE